MSSIMAALAGAAAAASDSTPRVITATSSGVTSQAYTTTVAISTFNPFSLVRGGATPYTYFVSSGTLPTGISLNASTGAVTGTPSAAQAASNVIFSVRDANNVVADTTVTVSFSVVAYITSTGSATTSSTGRRGGAITPVSPFSAVTGGTTPYTYYVSSGSLPAGLTIDPSTGQVAGTPTATYSAASVVFSVRDANMLVSATTKSITFTVTETTATASGTTSVSAGQNLAITSFNPLTASNGTSPYTYYITSGSLPTGITLNATTGLVSGTPTTTQSASPVSFAVQDTNGIVASTTTTVTFDVFETIATSYVIVAGGGASGARGAPVAAASGFSYGAGGGAGGVLTGTTYLKPGSSYTITVGGGGSPVASTTLGPQLGGSGTPSSIVGTGPVSLTSTGGGGGGGASSTNNGSTGASGGSAGGGAQWSPAPWDGTPIAGNPGGLATGSPGIGVAGTQGYPGGPGGPLAPGSGTRSSGGGGGAGGPAQSGQYMQFFPGGSSGPQQGIAYGGIGITTTITGTPLSLAGGGQGGGYGSSSSPSYSVFGGGGSNQPRQTGATNTGGGGASGTSGSFAGGSGVVIVSAPVAATTVTGTYTTGPDGAGKTYYWFTQSGTITY